MVDEIDIEFLYLWAIGAHGVGSAAWGWTVRKTLDKGVACLTGFWDHQLAIRAFATLGEAFEFWTGKGQADHMGREMPSFLDSQNAG